MNQIVRELVGATFRWAASSLIITTRTRTPRLYHHSAETRWYSRRAALSRGFRFQHSLILKFITPMSFNWER